MTKRQVYDGGRFRWRCAQVFLIHLLDGETVGLWPLGQRHWHVWLGPWERGVLDGHEGPILSRRQRRRMEQEGTLVCPSSFRRAPGTRTDKDQTVLPMCLVYWPLNR